jgi:hypothetical protein
MTTPPPTSQPRFRSAHHDPIRIVPLHVLDAMGRPAPAPSVPPQLTYRNGPLISNVEVFTMFWGQAWQQPANASIVQQINGFFDFILTSALMDQLAEYSVPGRPIGHGRRTGTTNITNPALGHSVSDSSIQHMLQQELATNSAVPKAGPNGLYFVFVPSGVRVVQGGSASCQAFCGYHNDIAGQIFYAVMPFPDCAGCLSKLSTLEALTSTSSHELCEAVTDPIPGQGWYDDVHGEIGDICAWQTKTLGAYTVQLEWSNKANACV